MSSGLQPGTSLHLHVTAKPDGSCEVRIIATLTFKGRAVRTELARNTYNDETLALVAVSDFAIERVCDIGCST